MSSFRSIVSNWCQANVPRFNSNMVSLVTFDGNIKYVEFDNLVFTKMTLALQSGGRSSTLLAILTKYLGARNGNNAENHTAAFLQHYFQQKCLLIDNEFYINISLFLPGFLDYCCYHKLFNKNPPLNAHFINSFKTFIRYKNIPWINSYDTTKKGQVLLINNYPRHPRSKICVMLRRYGQINDDAKDIIIEHYTYAPKVKIFVRFANTERVKGILNGDIIYANNAYKMIWIKNDIFDEKSKPKKPEQRIADKIVESVRNYSIHESLNNFKISNINNSKIYWNALMLLINDRDRNVRLLALTRIRNDLFEFNKKNLLKLIPKEILIKIESFIIESLPQKNNKQKIETDKNIRNLSVVLLPILHEINGNDSILMQSLNKIATSKYKNDQLLYIKLISKLCNDEYFDIKSLQNVKYFITKGFENNSLKIRIAAFYAICNINKIDQLFDFNGILFDLLQSLLTHKMDINDGMLYQIGYKLQEICDININYFVDSIDLYLHVLDGMILIKNIDNKTKYIWIIIFIQISINIHLKKQQLLDIGGRIITAAADMLWTFDPNQKWKSPDDDNQRNDYNLGSQLFSSMPSSLGTDVFFKALNIKFGSDWKIKLISLKICESILNDNEALQYLINHNFNICGDNILYEAIKIASIFDCAENSYNHHLQYASMELLNQCCFKITNNSSLQQILNNGFGDAMMNLFDLMLPKQQYLHRCTLISLLNTISEYVFLYNNNNNNNNNLMPLTKHNKFENILCELHELLTNGDDDISSNAFKSVSSLIFVIERQYSNPSDLMELSLSLLSSSSLSSIKKKRIIECIGFIIKIHPSPPISQMHQIMNFMLNDLQNNPDDINDFALDLMGIIASKLDEKQFATYLDGIIIYLIKPLRKWFNIKYEKWTQPILGTELEFISNAICYVHFFIDLFPKEMNKYFNIIYFVFIAILNYKKCAIPIKIKCKIHEIIILFLTYNDNDNDNDNDMGINNKIFTSSFKLMLESKNYEEFVSLTKVVQCCKNTVMDKKEIEESIQIKENELEFGNNIPSHIDKIKMEYDNDDDDDDDDIDDDNDNIMQPTPYQSKFAPLLLIEQQRRKNQQRRALSPLFDHK